MRTAFLSKSPSSFLFSGLHFIQSEGSTFSPSDISGLKLWLESESLDGLSDGDAISTWSDSSGNGYNATQTLTRRPTKQTLSGKSVARLDGSNDVLVNTAMTAIGAGDYTFFIVVKRNTGSGTYRTLFGLGTDGNGGYPMLSASTTNDAIVNPSGVGSFVTDGSWTDSLSIIEVRESSGTVYVKVYGGSETSGALSTTGETGYVLGDYISTPATQPFGGDVAEVIVYDSNLSSGDITSVESYLATKYSL